MYTYSTAFIVPSLLLTGVLYLLLNSIDGNDVKRNVFSAVDC